TLPSPSPTTVSAVKVICRPPLTVLATRLTVISFSSKPSELSRSLDGMRFPVAPGPGRDFYLRPRSLGAVRGRACTRRTWSELQTGFAGRLGKCLDATVITVTGTIESDRVDTRRQGTFGDGLAHRRGGGNVLGALQSFLDGLLQGAGT